MHQTLTRRARRAASGPALLGAVACTLAAPTEVAAAEPHGPAAPPIAQPIAQPATIIPGLTMRPEQTVLPVAHYELTGTFGNESGLWADAHTGLDFAAPYGTALRAIAAGVVTEVGYDGAYGEKTVIELEDGTVLWYCHQSSIGVREGQRVAAGDVIGAIGTTGNVTGPHLHLEVRRHGEPVDPAAVLREWGLRP